MNKTILDKTQLSLLVFENRYEVNQEAKFFSRCIDGRYANDKNLPALAFPGADAGELALVFGTAKAYVFEVDREKVFWSLIETVGEEKNIRFHSDVHADSKKVLLGCGHMKQIGMTPDDYQLEQEDVDFIRQKFEQMLNSGVRQDILQGDHNEGAVVYIKGDYGIYPKYSLEIEGAGKTDISIFEYHQSLVDERHRRLAKILLKNKAVRLPAGTDEEYLFQILSDTAEIQTLETVKRLAKGLPIFEVIFDKKGMFKINDLGLV